MKVAGIEVSDRAVLELAALLRQHGYAHTAVSLERAYDKVTAYYPLTIEEREQILGTLHDPPAGPLAALRVVLRNEHVGEVHYGLAEGRA